MADVKEKDDQFMHGRLPIGKDEKILAIYKHHWFAYASVWFMGLVLIGVIMGLAALVVHIETGDSGQVASNKSLIFGGATFFSAIIVLFTFVPVYLKSQEQVVLTEEALLQILQPSIFDSKISQLNLQHIADVSVRQDFFGTILGYGKVSVETPGEQDNYEFFMIPNPQAAAKDIISAHENYQAALQAGRLPSSLGTEPAPQVAQAPAGIDPQQYQQFLQYQQMVAKQAADQTGQNGQSDDNAQAEPSNQTDKTA